MKPLLLSLTLLLSGCTFLAFPVAPEPVQVALPVLPRTAGLKLQDQNLQITVQIPDGEGYVGVIWYQEDRELSRESIFIDALLPEVTFKQQVDPAQPHRVVLLYNQKIIRQYEYTPPKVEAPEPAKTEPATPADPSQTEPEAPDPDQETPGAPPAEGDPGPAEPPTQPDPAEEGEGSETPTNPPAPPEPAEGGKDVTQP